MWEMCSACAQLWVAPTAGLWAPAIKFFNNKYFLYYAASDTSLPGRGAAIGVASSVSPTGPWIDSGTPGWRSTPRIAHSKT